MTPGGPLGGDAKVAGRWTPVHPSSALETNEDGRLSDYVVYHELISTSRPFMRNVCAVDMAWVMPIMKKLEKMDVYKLSGGLEAAMTKPVEHKAHQQANKVINSSGTGDSIIDGILRLHLARWVETGREETGSCSNWRGGVADRNGTFCPVSHGAAGPAGANAVGGRLFTRCPAAFVPNGRSERYAK
ncbi:putative pre-mRNA-splicing factor ATP-dependent RNA helicase [Platanthera guangdongensis]|uniref:Pre-mRNA-splicing factor ATP-dependent RNA helicase n=1 Tax=Platanthera guangdongensis TaxID=2320717 RepID=A0ABR2LCB2_9ASPA